VESAQALVEVRGAVGVGFADVASDQSLGLEGQFDSGARGKEMSPTDFPLCVGGGRRMVRSFLENVISGERPPMGFPSADFSCPDSPTSVSIRSRVKGRRSSPGIVPRDEI
jgi:hypothetical protein